MFKDYFIDLKYFYWVAKNWRYLKGNRFHLISFFIYWVLYPIPRLFFGRKIAHKILSKNFLELNLGIIFLK